MIIDSTMKIEQPKEENDKAFNKLIDWDIIY